LNCTVPVGVPEPGAVAVTVDVKVIDCPKTEGFVDELTAVDVLSLFTVCVSVDDMLVAKLVSPLYVAVRL